MSKPYEEMANLNRLIHEPARLAILTALSACDSADYTFLRKITGMTAGNLSAHISKLEEGRMVTLEKNFINKRPNTLVKITNRGHEAINNHWSQLQALREASGKVDLNQA